MSSIDKVTLNNQSYDVSLAPTGNLDTTTVNKFVSQDNTLTPPEYRETGLISESDSHKTIFQKLTQMINNVRYLYQHGSGSSTELLNKVYPVGSIYQSYSNVDPSTLFGGTWESIGQGRVLVGADGSEYIGGNTGGNKTHTLITNEIPTHNHDVQIETKDGAHHHGFDEDDATAKSGEHEHALPLGVNMDKVTLYDGCSMDTGSRGYMSYLSNISTTYDKETALNYERYINTFKNRNNSSAHTHSLSDVKTNGTGSEHTHSITCSDTGSGIAFNIEQPYLVVYMWRRLTLAS